MAAAPPPAEFHAEDRDIVLQLAALQDMHNQVKDLRTLLPQRLWSPLLSAVKAPHDAACARSPAALFAQLKKTADDGCHEMEKFTTAWHSEEMQALWAKTRADKYPQGSATWRADYIALAEILKTSNASMPEGDQVNGEDERVQDVIDKFRARGLQAKVETSDEPKIFPLAFKVAGMSFSIDNHAEDTKDVYVVGEKSGAKASTTQREILDWISGNAKWKKLSELLVS